MHVFDQLLQTESFVDVTLTCSGHSIKAHKIVLSACSPYFQSLFSENPCQHPVIIMREVEWPELKAAVEFMYKGEINVCRDQIGPLLRLAEMLKIRGLTDVKGDPALGDAGCLETTSAHSSQVVFAKRTDGLIAADDCCPSSKKPKATKQWDIARNIESLEIAMNPIVPRSDRKRSWTETNSAAGSPLNCSSLTPDRFAENHSPYPPSPASQRSGIAPGVHQLFQPHSTSADRETSRERDQQQQLQQQFQKHHLHLQSQIQQQHQHQQNPLNTQPQVSMQRINAPTSPKHSFSSRAGNSAPPPSVAAAGLLNHPMRMPLGSLDDMEIKPEIAEMIREEEMVSSFLR